MFQEGGEREREHGEIQSPVPRNRKGSYGGVEDSSGQRRGCSVYLRLLSPKINAGSPLPHLDWLAWLAVTFYQLSATVPLAV